MSDWNDFLEGKLARDLTVEEHRLADALARNLLGFARLEDHIGDRLLMKQARFTDRRSLVKARDSLVTKKLLYVEKPKTTGRGHRTLYRLLIGETRGADHAFTYEEETRGHDRAIPAETRGETRGPHRARIKQRTNTNLLLDEHLSPKANHVDDARPVEAVLFTDDRPSAYRDDK